MFQQEIKQAFEQGKLEASREIVFSHQKQMLEVYTRIACALERLCDKPSVARHAYDKFDVAERALLEIAENDAFYGKPFQIARDALAEIYGEEKLCENQKI